MSEEKTFKMRTGPGPDDVEDFPFQESFELFGETWVVHRRRYGIGWAVSHRDTGTRVPESERGRDVEAKHHGTVFLTKNQDKIQVALEKARKR